MGSNQSETEDLCDVDKHKLLDELVTKGRKDLYKIESEARKFNIFNVFGATEQELKHSNMLGWLLDPAGQHHFGDRFLREFLFEWSISVHRRLMQLSILS